MTPEPSAVSDSQLRALGGQEGARARLAAIGKAAQELETAFVTYGVEAGNANLSSVRRDFGELVRRQGGDRLSDGQCLQLVEGMLAAVLSRVASSVQKLNQAREKELQAANRALAEREQVRQGVPPDSAS